MPAVALSCRVLSMRTRIRCLPVRESMSLKNAPRALPIRRLPREVVEFNRLCARPAQATLMNWSPPASVTRLVSAQRHDDG